MKSRQTQYTTIYLHIFLAESQIQLQTVFWKAKSARERQGPKTLSENQITNLIK